MLGRFKARRSGNGPNGRGVWDNASNGWRAVDLSEQQARETIEELDLQYDAHGPRPAENVRHVQPAQPVDQAEWQPAGVLEVWIRERGQWTGRVRTPDGRTTWIPATELYPSTRQAPPGRTDTEPPHAEDADLSGTRAARRTSNAHE